MGDTPELYDDEFELLVDSIAAALRRDGYVEVTAEDLDVSTTVWRRAARAAGRQLRVPVRTGRAGGLPDLRPRLPSDPEGGWTVWARAEQPESN